MATTSSTNVGGGDWQTAGNWSGGIPTSSVDTTLGSLSGAYTVTLNSGETDAANSLTISASNATLQLLGTTTLTVTGTVSNSGFLYADALLSDGGGTLTVG